METEEIFETNNVTAFRIATIANAAPVSELGIHFKSEITLDDITSKITDKYVKLSDANTATTNYLKVVRIIELNTQEKAEVNKARDFFKKMYDTIFKGQKINVFWAASYLTFITFALANENFLGALIDLALLSWLLGLRQGIKEFIRVLNPSKEAKTLEGELSNWRLAQYSSCVSDKDDVTLYFKFVE